MSTPLRKDWQATHQQLRPGSVRSIFISVAPLTWMMFQRAAIAGGHRSVTAWARHTIYKAAGLVEE